MSRDLFGRPMYDTPSARQHEMFSDKHWFAAGYRDAGAGAPRPADAEPAYIAGYDAGRRDTTEGKHSAWNACCAWVAAKAVGNVSEG